MVVVSSCILINALSESGGVVGDKKVQMLEV